MSYLIFFKTISFGFHKKFKSSLGRKTKYIMATKRINLLTLKKLYWRKLTPNRICLSLFVRVALFRSQIVLALEISNLVAIFWKLELQYNLAFPHYGNVGMFSWIRYTWRFKNTCCCFSSCPSKIVKSNLLVQKHEIIDKQLHSTYVHTYRSTFTLGRVIITVRWSRNWSGLR